MKHKYILIFVSLIVIFVLVSSLKGVWGNPSPEEIRGSLMEKSMPFELSPERGRYALLTQVANSSSVTFPLNVAKYVVPDLGYHNGRFVSLFAPGVSYVALPLHIVGEKLNLSQVFAFSTVSIFAFMNFLLIVLIVRKFTGGLLVGLISGLSFLFATNAFSYSTTLYQHHITSFLILFSAFLLFDELNNKNAILVSSVFGLGFFVDYPNGLFLFPILIYFLSKYLKLGYNRKGNKVTLLINNSIIIAFIVIFISFIPGLRYNLIAYDNPLQLAGTVQNVNKIETEETSDELIIETGKSDKSAVGFFDINKLPNSMSVLLTSKDRGLVWFAPVILLGIFGVSEALKTNKNMSLTLLSVSFLILFLYGMWGDPWGGWAYGPRYLIPFFALGAIFVGVAINKYKDKIWFSSLFLLTFAYGLFVNLAGALTTNQIPPSVEIEYQNIIKPVYLNAYSMIVNNTSSSFLYNNYFGQFVALKYYFWVMWTLIYVTTLIIYFISLKEFGKDTK